MTDEDMEKLKKRIEHAETLKRRIKCLQNIWAQLMGSDQHCKPESIVGIVFSWNDKLGLMKDSAIGYATPTRELNLEFNGVCWGYKETEMLERVAKKLKNCLVEAMEEELSIAKKALEAL